MSFGSYVRTARQARGVALNALAPRLGLSAAYWSRIECDMDHPPRDDVLSILAKEIGLDLDEVFVKAGRLPPDMRPHLDAIVKMWRKKQAREQRREQ